MAQEVIEGDDEIDDTYLDIEQRVLDLIATQAPVAMDLRLLSAILHINLDLERVGDQSVNVAKMTRATIDLPRSDIVIRQLAEMGDVVCTMLRTAMEAFAMRNKALAEQLPEMDEPVDRLNRNMYREVIGFSADPLLLEWGIHMNLVARYIERVGDRAVDIGEQVEFLATGEFLEFTDASHPQEP